MLVVELEHQIEYLQHEGLYNQNLDPNNKSANKGARISPAVAYAGQVAIPTPLSYMPVTNNVNTSTGMNTSSRSRARITADVVDSIYNSMNGDMLSVDLEIIGDPTLLKQDDWLYTASPAKSKGQYNAWDSLSQFNFAKKYGHIRMDTGEVVVNLEIKTPIDIDTDWQNQGLMTPVPAYTKSMFSGQYVILMIENTFSNGKFTQKLQMARYLNQEVIDYLFPERNKPIKDGRDSVKTNLVNQTNTAGTNASKVEDRYGPGAGTPYPSDGQQIRQ